MSGHRRILKGQPLSARALGFLLKLGDAQNQLQLRAVPVGRVIDPASPSQWDALHVIGRRLLSESRKAVRRVLTLSLVYRLSGEERFLAGARREMLAAAAFLTVRFQNLSRRFVIEGPGALVPSRAG